MDLILGALLTVLGAFVGVIGQALIRWCSRPRLDFEVRSKKIDSDGVIYRIYLVLHNKGRKTIADPYISIIKYDDDGNVSTNYKFTLNYKINPKDSLFVEIGKTTVEPSIDGVRLGGGDSV